MKKILFVFLAIAIVFTACKEDESNGLSTNPSISEIVPALGQANQVITLKGKRFSNVAAENIVKFSGVRAEIVSAQDTLLTVIVPANGSTGTVTITVKDRTSKGPMFTYGTAEVEYDYLTSTYAGTGTAGDTYGPLLEASFRLPNGVSYDPTTGDLIVADRSAQAIKRITKEGMVTKISGIGTNASVDGDLQSASFANPYKTAVDKNGNIYVVDNGSHRVRKIDFSTNQVSTLAGGGTTAAFEDGQGSAARFNTLTGIAVDNDLNVYVADAVNHAIRKITPTGKVTTLAGNGTAGIVDGVYPNVRLNRPTAVCIGKDGFLYAADRFGQRIRKIDIRTGRTITIAGSGGNTQNTGGHVDGEALKARFNNPWGIEIDKEGTIYVSELEGSSTAVKSHTIRMIKNGQVSTIGGNPTFNAPGYVNGLVGVSRFYNPTDIAADEEGNIFIGDMNNFVIRKIVKVPKN